MSNYSQHGEEEVIRRLFEGVNNGRFLDVGAHDGRTFSNTLALVEERGWSGVCVEPSPMVFPRLMETHKDRPGIKLVNVALAADAGLVRFFDSMGDCVSTTDLKHYEVWKEAANFREIYLATITPAALLARFAGPYDFVSIDVEGTNFALVQSIQWAAVGARVICVEFEDHLDEIERWLAPFGYRRKAICGCNTVLVRG
jgi:FkbM family methyltransferase